MIILTPFSRCLTVWPFMFVSRAQSEDPGVIAHETVHYRRQAWWSPVWILLYVLLPSFKFAEEKLGYAAQIAWYKKNGWAIGQSPETMIVDMANEYGGMCTFQQATDFVNSELNPEKMLT